MHALPAFSHNDDFLAGGHGSLSKVITKFFQKRWWPLFSAIGGGSSVASGGLFNIWNFFKGVVREREGLASDRGWI